jgi:hypothetical protein
MNEHKGSNDFETKRAAVAVITQIQNKLIEKGYEYVGSHQGYFLYYSAFDDVKASIALHTTIRPHTKGESILRVKKAKETE